MWECDSCGQKRRVLGWDYDPEPRCCDGDPMTLERGPERAATVIGDEIDFVAVHGMCDEHTGEPKRYRSRAELKREERRRGWTPKGETPNYRPEY